jgi:hypothetical protein
MRFPAEMKLIEIVVIVQSVLILALFTWVWNLHNDSSPSSVSGTSSRSFSGGSQSSNYEEMMLQERLNQLEMAEQRRQMDDFLNGR